MDVEVIKLMMAAPDIPEFACSRHAPGGACRISPIPLNRVCRETSDFRAAAASNSLRERLLKTPRFFAAKPLSRFLDFCNMQVPYAFRPAGSAPPSRVSPDQTKDFVQKTVFAPCECVILSTADRTKMFHVRHFGTIEPQNRTNLRVRTALKNLREPKPSP